MKLLYGVDVLDGLKTLPDESVNCCVTSPPYWGLRDYGVEGQIGAESTPDEYVSRMAEIFDEVKRVLADDGTLWLNLGDCYYSKSLVGIPWMVAFALKNNGWYLRQDIIWAKKNCMPESVKDRCTRSHEYIFMFSKKNQYFYNSDAIKEPAIYDVDGTGTEARKSRQTEGNKSMPDSERSGIRPARIKNAKNFKGKNGDKQRGHSRRHAGFNDRWDSMSKEEQCSGYRNKRDVWTIAPAQYPQAHFATFPQEIPYLCIMAGCPEGGTVLDPFSGSGTTGAVATGCGRDYIGIDLNIKYFELARQRIGLLALTRGKL